MLLDPGTGLIMFVVGGIGTLVSFTAFKTAQEIGPKIEPSDLLPMPPPAPPLPRFLYKPGVMESMRRN